MQAIFSDRLAKSVGPFSPAVRSDAPGHIFVSGQIGQLADTGKLVEGGIERETEQVLANLGAVLEASDRSFPDVVRATVYLTNMADFAAVIDHAPEGQTDKVSELRGHPVDAAAKCIVLIVKIGKKTSRFILAVVSGNARVDTARVKSLFNGATYAGFAATDVAERLTGSVVGTVLPFAFHPDLTLIVDPSITKQNELFFNAARLDRSMALRTSDYIAVAKPRIERIAGD
jgi:Ala-tRNA(Pro) deacylase